MKTINLANKKTSDIKFEVFSYPDGQQDIRILGSSEWERHPNDYKSFEIKARLCNFKDLELIICTTHALQRLGAKSIYLYIPYLLGGRSDRQFLEGGTSYLVDVVAPILNSLHFEQIKTIDAHSDVAAACIHNLVVEDNNKLIRHVLYDLYEPMSPDEFVFVSPDAGALKKIYKAAEKVGYVGNVLICTKDRDTAGKLSKVTVPYISVDSTKDLIIIDDLCDGGRTFIEIAKKMKDASYTSKIYLVVTHGVFSQGFDELSKYIDRIYCTNSFRDVQDEEWMNTDKRIFINQLNVY